MAQALVHTRRIWRLKGRVQHYAWGNVGSSSTVAQLYHADLGTKVDESKPYAELWWGTHKSAPADVYIDEADQAATVPLAEIIGADPALVLGESTANSFQNELPYLLKVLSINKALSIQAHPDSNLAKTLHKNFPQHYADANHKPEIAIALTPFNAMCGFRCEAEIIHNIKETPELASILGESGKALISGNFSPETLRAAFHALMVADEKSVKEHLDAVLQRTKDKTDLISQTLRQINADFPGDVGLFCPFLFNVVVLQPGEALFLAPNEPHAYFKGDCVECMACSDNVVRAGLTPKFKHVDVLVDMLTYKCGPADIQRCAAAAAGSSSVQSADTFKQSNFQPPIPEFEVSVYEIPSQQSHPGTEITLPPTPGASILLAVKGHVEVEDASSQTPSTKLDVKRGSSAFVYANTAVKLRSKSTEPVTVFRATTSTTTLPPPPPQ